MSRLDSRSTSELWGKKQKTINHIVNTYETVSFFRMGIIYMERKNRNILAGITMLDLENNKYLKQLYEDRAKTIEYYRKRLKDFGE